LCGTRSVFESDKYIFVIKGLMYMAQSQLIPFIEYAIIATFSVYERRVLSLH